MATQAQQKAFIGQIAPLMVAQARQRGYKCVSAAIAQACLESGYGLSKLASVYHNYFGLKCGGYWNGASVNMKTCEEYTPGVLSSISDNFRAYSNIEEGVKGYYDFISTARYKAVTLQSTPQAYLTAIRAAGYATSTKYVENNMNVVFMHNLFEWDRVLEGTIAEPVSIPTVEEIIPEYIIGKTYVLQAEMNVRTGAGTDSRKKTHDELTENGKLNDKDGDGALDKGTKVTCQEIERDGSNIWIRIPSGWIAAYYQGNRYAA